MPDARKVTGRNRNGDHIETNRGYGKAIHKIVCGDTAIPTALLIVNGLFGILIAIEMTDPARLDLNQDDDALDRIERYKVRLPFMATVVALENVVSPLLQIERRDRFANVAQLFCSKAVEHPIIIKARVL